MAETYQTPTQLNAETVASDVDRKQNQRLLIAGAISVATNVLFLLGAANGMSEKALSLEEPPTTYISFTAVATPAPVTPTPVPVVTPAPPTQVAKVEATPAPKPKERVKTPPPQPKPRRVQIAKVEPPKPRLERERVKPPVVTEPEVQPTPPPVKPPEETLAEVRQKNVEVEQNKGAEAATEAARAATAAASNAGAPGSKNGGRPSRVASGAVGSSAANPGAISSGRLNSGSSAPSLRLGVSGGSDAAGTSGIVGETRSTGSIIGSAGNMAGATLSNGSGPKLGLGGGKSGSRDKILTQSESAGGAANGDFTVAKGTGLRPGAIVARTGIAGGGAPGQISDATLGARVSGGGNGSGDGGSDSIGAIFKRSVGPGGGSGGPVGLRVGKGPGAGGGTGVMSGGANGTIAGVSGNGLAGGGGPGRGDARTNGSGGGGGGGGAAVGGTRGGSDNGIAGGVGTGKSGRGNGNGPGGEGNGKGLANRGDSVGKGKGGTGSGSGDFGIKNGAGTGANVNKTGTGTANGVQSVGVAIEARGGNGADIVTTKVGQREDREGAKLVQVKSKDVEDGRKVSGPTAKDLSTKVTQGGFKGKTLAKATRSPRPRITDEMKASAKRPAEVEFTIGSNGSASFKLTRSSGDPDVDAAVLAACSGYRWVAATSDGTPVSTTVKVNFDPNE